MGSIPLREDGAAALLDVWIVPGAARTEIIGLHDGALRVRIAAPPEAGRANRALEKHLAAITGSKVAVISGHRGRRKRIRIESADLAAIASRLGIGSG